MMPIGLTPRYAMLRYFRYADFALMMPPLDAAIAAAFSLPLMLLRMLIITSGNMPRLLQRAHSL